MTLFKRFRKSISLRIVNWLGLSVMFASLLFSYSYIKRELSYDRYNVHADRMVRMSLQYDDKPVDGRIYGNELDAILQQIPEIEQVVKLSRINTAVLTFEGEKQVLNDAYFTSPNILDVFSISLVQGDNNNALQKANQILVSESFARQLLGGNMGKTANLNGININGRQVGDSAFFISGIFKDIPGTSHFHTDILLYRPDTREGFDYVYLLLKNHTDIRQLEQKVIKLIEEKDKETNEQVKTRVLLMPLTDVHLHSHNLREMEPNGNINYIYLVVGANLLLLLVVSFNLWLNASLIFSYNRRYYQLLRLNGASSHTVMKDEAMLAVLLGCLSVLTGLLTAYFVSSAGSFPIHITLGELATWCLLFLLLTVLVSLLPVIKNISSTLFLNSHNDLRPVRFSYANVKYMLTAQYALVMIVVIMTFGISQQMKMVKGTQVGGNNSHILVMKEQPGRVIEKYELLKSELLQHTEIESVTACFQLPGDAIRDAISIKTENSEDWKKLPILIVDEDFLPFFQVHTIAGQGFSPAKYDHKTEEKMFSDFVDEKKRTDSTEEYIINRKALAVLGFASPEEAIGQTLLIEQGYIDYINRGVIVGVTDDFNYTGLHEAAIPMLVMQRRMFLHCFMVRLDSARFQQSLATFNYVWNEVNPGYPADYTFMNDVFGRVYRNELNAERLVYIFSALCIVIASLGLIILMAFIIKRRTKEIGIRKVNGAGFPDILLMLNMNFVRWIALGFVIAVPVAWYVMHRWLEHFAYRISLSWWIFALAGLAVMTLSLILVSLQSWRAANTNPVEAIKSE